MLNALRSLVRRYPKLSLSVAGSALLSAGTWLYQRGRNCGPCPCGKKMVVIPSSVTLTAGQQVQFSVGCK